MNCVRPVSRRSTRSRRRKCLLAVSFRNGPTVAEFDAASRERKSPDSSRAPIVVSRAATRPRRLPAAWHRSFASPCRNGPTVRPGGAAVYLIVLSAITVISVWLTAETHRAHLGHPDEFALLRPILGSEGSRPLRKVCPGIQSRGTTEPAETCVAPQLLPRNYYR
jgi:hypothetical protein